MRIAIIILLTCLNFSLITQNNSDASLFFRKDSYDISPVLLGQDYAEPIRPAGRLVTITCPPFGGNSFCLIAGIKTGSKKINII